MPIMFVRKTPKPARKGKELEAWVRSHLEKLAALRGYSYTRPDAKFLRSAGKYTDRQVADFVLYAAEKGVWFLECKETAKSVFDQYEYATDVQRAHIEKIQEWRKNSWGEHWHAGFLIHFTRYAAYRWVTRTNGVITPDSGEAWSWEYFYEN